MTAVLCLLNPHAQGGRLRHRAPALAQAVAQRAPAARWAAPETLEEALSLLRSLPPGSRVLAFGGDGTVNRWLPALLKRGHTLGLVPMGSGNDLARALGVFDMPWTEALECALTSAAVPMDVGLVEVPAGEGSAGVEDSGAAGHPPVEPFRVHFLSSLAVGFDASVGLRALRGPRWLRGQPRYLWATLQELVHLRSWGLRISCEGGGPGGEGASLGGSRPGQGGAPGTWQGRVLLASTLNTRSYGSGMPAAPDARIDDGRLELLRAQALGRAGVLTLLPRLLRGTHLADRRVSLQTFQTLQAQAEDPVPLAVDGEFLGEFSRFAVRVLPGGLSVVKATNSSHFGK